MMRHAGKLAEHTLSRVDPTCYLFSFGQPYAAGHPKPYGPIMLLSMPNNAASNQTIVNLDLGRNLEALDVVDQYVYPISAGDEGAYCYHCQEPHSLGQLQGLTRSTGVFTSRVLCEMKSPVYLCLEHIPYERHQFEAFTPEVAAMLLTAQRQRDENAQR